MIRALASSSRLVRKAAGGLPSVAVQMATSSARLAVFSSESLGIAGCLMCLSTLMPDSFNVFHRAALIN
jgi:hypothetical protein